MSLQIVSPPPPYRDQFVHIKIFVTRIALLHGGLDTWRSRFDFAIAPLSAAPLLDHRV
jgi:hypothetical protein